MGIKHVINQFEVSNQEGKLGRARLTKSKGSPGLGLVHQSRRSLQQFRLVKDKLPELGIQSPSVIVQA